MTKVLHLIDDAAFGGVTGMLNSLLPHLAGYGDHERRVVRTIGALPWDIVADIVVVHFTASWAKLPYLLALRHRHRGPMVMVEHSYTAAYEQLCVPHQRRFRMMLRQTYRLFDQVIAVSGGQANWLRQAKLVASDRLLVIPPSRDLSAFYALPLAQRAPGPLRLGTYGRFAPQKGFDRLLAAMALLPRETAILHLAGFGPDAPMLEKMAAGLPNVRIETAIADPVAVLAGVDAVVFPSRWEAGGTMAAESRAAGRPLIVANIDCFIEHVASGAGVTVDAAQPAAIAEAIRAFAAADLSAMALAARASASGHFEHHLALWQGVFDRLTQRSRLDSAA